MSINWQLDAEPAPALLVLPPAAASLDEAHAAIELWEHYSGKALDPTQRLVVEVMMAETAAGRWAAATTGREMPRQNGKGDELEVVELWGLVQRAEAVLHTVHDAVLLASQAQQRMLAVLDHRDLRPKVKRKWLGTGQQMIEFRNGGVIWYRTRTGAGGRGVDDISRLVVDEAQHATSEQMAAVTPTLLANSNPQLNAVGTAGLEGHSEWWWRMRKRALSSDPGAFGYVGHTAERVRLEGDRVISDLVDVEDRSLWRRANPAVTASRGGGMAFLEEQLKTLGPQRFAEEHLCVWAPEPSAGAGVIDMGIWQMRADTRSKVLDPVAFAVDVKPDRSSASISLAGARDDDKAHVEVVQTGDGTSWVVPRLLELVEAWDPCVVVVDPGSAAGSLLTSLREGLERIGSTVEVLETTARDVAQACGQLFDAVKDDDMVHYDQPSLNAALLGAKKRPLGDAWAWDRKKYDSDITPLVATTLALWGFNLKKAEVTDLAASVW